MPQWPPGQDDIVKWGPYVLVGLAGPITLLAATSFRVRLSIEDIARRDEETKRRVERLKEFLQVLEQCEDVESDVLGQITYEIVSTKCMELFPLGTGSKALSDGVDWCAKLMIKELRIGAKRTASQADTEYSDGSKLEKLLTIGKERLDYIIRESGTALRKEVRTTLTREMRKAERVQSKLKRRDLRKAVKLFTLVKGAWPWIATAGLVTVSLSSLSTLTLHYRVEVLETFRRESFSRRGFVNAATAMVVVEMSATLLRVLEFQLNDLGHGIASRNLQVELFKALMKKDLQWWEMQRDPRKIMNQLFSLGKEVGAFLDVPLTGLKRFVSIATHAALIRQSSSGLLYMMLAAHGANFFARKMLSRSHECLARIATRAVCLPTESDFTWSFALMPQNVALYQSFVRDDQETRSFSEYLEAVSGFHNKKEIVGELLNPLNTIFNQGRSISQIYGTGLLVQNGLIQYGQAESFIKYAGDISREFEKAWEENNKLQSKSSGLAQAYDLITIPPAINPDIGIVPDSCAIGRIVFEDVQFEYPSRKARVLNGVSFQVEPGQTIGVTGPVGCGKSSALLLLQRLYDVTSGRILLDGRDIREYSPQWLRSQMAMVSQEPQLLSMSIRENIAFGCSHDPSLEEIKEACVAANIWDALSDPDKFPEGLQTHVSLAKNLSGGEKQRICIARAILANRPILLLDEATSALDEGSQIKVQEALERLMTGRTSIVVAHRLSTIRKADKIIVLQAGVVAEEGTHDEHLQRPQGLYNELWRQSSGLTSA